MVISIFDSKPPLTLHRLGSNGFTVIRFPKLALNGILKNRLDGIEKSLLIKLQHKTRLFTLFNFGQTLDK
jgi:hypothetical protein